MPKAKSGWTPERRNRQAALIREWQPWNQSTGPKSAKGKAVVARNAFKGGEWRELRELTRRVNALLREHKHRLTDL